jgi:hypothetical protein
MLACFPSHLGALRPLSHKRSVGKLCNLPSFRHNSMMTLAAAELDTEFWLSGLILQRYQTGHEDDPDRIFKFVIGKVVFTEQLGSISTKVQKVPQDLSSARQKTPKNLYL